MRVLTAAIILIAAFAFIGIKAYAASPPEGEMSLSAPVTVPDGSSFTVDVSIVSTPSAGYLGFQERVKWAPSLDFVSLETISSHCTLPISPVFYSPNDVLIPCVSFPIPLVPFTDVGVVHRLTLICHSPGGAALLMTGTNLDSIFVSPGLQEIPVATVGVVNVLCPAQDSDGDGCSDPRELALGLDPGNPLDWSDFDHSGAIDIADIALIVQDFGQPSAYDRTGDGVVSVGDITRVVRIFGLVCA